MLLCAAVAYSWMSVEQHRLAAKWQSQNITSLAVPDAAEADPNSVTFLVIPKIDLRAAILDGIGLTSLLLAPGHLEKTAWPGDPGNAVIAAHRDTFFRHTRSRFC